MFERYTDKSRRAVVLAQEYARTFNHGALGTEHLLLGVVQSEDDVVGKVLAAFDFDKASTLIAAMRPSVDEVRVHLPFTNRCKKVLELALRESLQLGFNHIDPYHMLLAFIREGQGGAAQALAAQNFDLGTLRTDVVAVLTDGTRPTRRIAPYQERRDHCVIGMEQLRDLLGMTGIPMRAWVDQETGDVHLVTIPDEEDDRAIAVARGGSIDPRYPFR